MSAREEFPKAVSANGLPRDRIIQHAAMCDRIDTLTEQLEGVRFKCDGLLAQRDTLTAENAELEQSIANGDSFEAMIVAERDAARADLRSLKAAVARLKRVSEPTTQWYEDLQRLVALVPSDGSWETEHG